jgi:hypothetical protein
MGYLDELASFLLGFFETLKIRNFGRAQSGDSRKAGGFVGRGAGAQKRSVLNVREHLSTGSTYQKTDCEEFERSLLLKILSLLLIPIIRRIPAIKIAQVELWRQVSINNSLFDFRR